MVFDRSIILDACCFINIYASGRMAAIIEALPIQAGITATVYDLELLHLRDIDALNSEGEELLDLVDRGVVVIEDFANENEQIAFLNYAATIGDDGEAASFAIAEARGYAVATDDKKARQFANAEISTVPLYYTLEIVEHWVSVKNISDQELREALLNIRNHGSYVPAPSHPLRDWWNAHI